jgi:HEAT repeat protein
VVTTQSGLASLLDQLGGGAPATAVQVAGLSDLGRDDAALLRARWPSISMALRESTLQRAIELAEDNVDFNFTRLGQAALSDPAPSVRRRAVEVLWESEDRRVVADLTALLRTDFDEAVRAAAARVLGHVVLAREFDAFDAAAGDDVVEALRERTQDPAEAVDVRAGAVESLGPRSLPWVDQVIMDAYYSDDSRLRLAALRAMGNSASDHYLEFLEEQAASDDPLFRHEAALAAGGIASEEAVPFLTAMLTDEDTEVQFAAVMALGGIGGQQAVRALENLRPGNVELEAVVKEALAAASELASPREPRL